MRNMRHDAPVCPPSARPLAHLGDREIVALAFNRSRLEAPRLARALGLTPEELRRAVRLPGTLTHSQRLALAAVVGRDPNNAVLSRELRRRALAAAHEPMSTRIA